MVPARSFLRGGGLRARGLTLVVGLPVAAVAAAACAPGPSGRAVLRVYAASSLTEAFGDMERAFERAHPDTDVTIVFGGSQVLRLQVEQGARVDVFASADADHVRALVEADLVVHDRAFARNELVVVVPRSNPVGIERFEDLSRAGTLVLGTEQVPVGRYARAVLRHAGATLGGTWESEVLGAVVSEEANTRLVLAKVTLDAADAAIVYRTDAASSDGVRVVSIPDSLNVSAEYRIGVVRDTEVPGPSRAWIDFVTSPRGSRILRGHGFGTVP